MDAQKEYKEIVEELKSFGLCPFGEAMLGVEYREELNVPYRPKTGGQKKKPKPVLKEQIYRALERIYKAIFGYK